MGQDGARTTSAKALGTAGAASGLDSATHDFLRALASPARQRIALLFAGGAELTVSEVAEQAGISQSTASEQLAVLRKGGMVRSRRDGKAVRYRGDPDGIARALGDLQTYLKTCC